MVSSKTYVVVWDEVLDNVIDISNQLNLGDMDYLVFDISSKPIARLNWKVADKVRYYGHFYNGLVDFVNTEHEIFIFNAGDCFSNEHIKLAKDVELLMKNDPDAWIVSPRIINDELDGIKTMIDMSKIYKNYSLSTHVNGIWVALRRDLAVFILNYYNWLLRNKYMDFEKMISGYCLDIVYSAWTIYNNKKIYFNWSSNMTTIIGSTHDGTTTLSDCHNIKNRFIQYVNSLGINSDGIKTIYHAIDDKVNNYSDRGYPIHLIYPNMKNMKGFLY